MRKRAQRRSQQQAISRMEKMASSTEKPRRIFNKNWPIVVSLVFIILLVFFLTSYFNYTSGIAINPEGKTLPEKYYLSGPDPYYNMRIVEKQYYTGHYPYWHSNEPDPLLNYPLSKLNSRPPLFNSLFTITAKFFSLFMSDINAIGLSMQFLNPLYGALLVIPVYLIGALLFNKKVGILSALFVAFIPIHLGSGHGAAYSLADHDSFILLIATSMYFFILKSLKEEDNKRSAIYAGIAGTLLAVEMLSWAGGYFFFAFLALYFVIQMFVDIVRYKGRNRFFINSIIIFGIGYFVSLPSYMMRGSFSNIAFFSMVSVFLFGIIYLFLNKKKLPWVLTVPAIFAIAGISLTFLYLIKDTTIPSLRPLTAFAHHIFEGLAYVEKSKTYLTIAEASTFGISRTVMSFGPALYLIAWIGFAYLIIWKRLIKKWEPAVMFFTIWFLVEAYLTTAAGRFLNDLVPLVVILSAAITWFLIEKVNYKQMIKTLRNVRGWRGIKKAVKLSHVLGILFIAFCIVLPNAYLSFDAAVPFGKMKNDFSLKGSAFGLSLHTEQYWTDAFSWLERQNKNIKNESKRPAFISWWDYGFYCVAMGHNPTVADNFQDGIEPAGNFQTAQSEDEAIAVLIIRLIEGNMAKHNGKVSESVRQIFSNYLGNSSTELISILEDPMHHQNSTYNEIIGENYIEKYSNNKENLNKVYRVRAKNAMYHDSVKLLTSILNDEQINKLYHDIQMATGYSIRYYGVEGYDINIFNVFTFLSDKGVFGYETPEDNYFKLYYKDKDGHSHTVEEVRNMTRKELVDLQLKRAIEHKQPFFDSMAYRTYVGQIRKEDYEKYSSTGYFYQLLQLNHLYAPTQGLRHFVAEYISPVTKDKPLVFVRGTECYGMPAVVISKYYEGAFLNGTIKCMGNPYRVAVAVEKTTVGTPVTVKHDMTVTDNNGSFSLIAPAGNVSLLLFLNDWKTGKEYDIKTISFNSTKDPNYYPITDNEAMRMNGTNYTRMLNITVPPSSISGYVFNDTNGNNSYDLNKDVPLSNVTIQIRSIFGENSYNATTDSNGHYNISNVLPGIYNLVATYNGFDIHKNESLFLPSGTTSYNISNPKPSSVKGKIFYDRNGNNKYDAGEAIKGANVKLIYSKTGLIAKTNITDSSGEYMFTGVVPGEYRINATKLNVTTGELDYMVDENITLNENETKTFDVQIGLASVQLSGYTYYNGAAIGNVSINFEANTATTAKSVYGILSNGTTGYYETKLKPGNYNISAFASIINSTTNTTATYTYKGAISIAIGDHPRMLNIIMTRVQQ